MSLERERREQEQSPSPIVFFLHAYQPPRELYFANNGHGETLQVYPEVNEQICQEVYRPILVSSGERFPQGMVFSFYSTLREWMKSAHPDDFEKMVDLVGRQRPGISGFGRPFYSRDFTPFARRRSRASFRFRAESF